MNNLGEMPSVTAGKLLPAHTSDRPVTRKDFHILALVNIYKAGLKSSRNFIAPDPIRRRPGPECQHRPLGQFGRDPATLSSPHLGLVISIGLFHDDTSLVPKPSIRAKCTGGFWQCDPNKAFIYTKGFLNNTWIIYLKNFYDAGLDLCFAAYNATTYTRCMRAPVTYPASSEAQKETVPVTQGTQCAPNRTL